jgi:hypothetical protein
MANHTGVPQTPSGPHESVDVEAGTTFIVIGKNGPTPPIPSAVGTNADATEPKPTPTGQEPGFEEH